MSSNFPKKFILFFTEFTPHFRQNADPHSPTLLGAIFDKKGGESPRLTVFWLILECLDGVFQLLQLIAEIGFTRDRDLTCGALQGVSAGGGSDLRNLELSSDRLIEEDHDLQGAALGSQLIQVSFPGRDILLIVIRVIDLHAVAGGADTHGKVSDIVAREEGVVGAGLAGTEVAVGIGEDIADWEEEAVTGAIVTGLPILGTGEVQVFVGNGEQAGGAIEGSAVDGATESNSSGGGVGFGGLLEGDAALTAQGDGVIGSRGARDHRFYADVDGDIQWGASEGVAGDLSAAFLEGGAQVVDDILAGPEGVGAIALLPGGEIQGDAAGVALPFAAQLELVTGAFVQNLPEFPPLRVIPSTALLYLLRVWPRNRRPAKFVRNVAKMFANAGIEPKKA